MTNKTLITTVMALAACAFSAGAAAQPVIGKYIGLDYGRTTISDLTSGDGAGIYGGKRFSERWALEAGYRRLLSESGAALSAIQASGVIFQPVTHELDAYARLGASWIRASNGAQRESTTRLLAGVGLDYRFTREGALRVEYQQLASDTRSVLVGIRFEI